MAPPPRSIDAGSLHSHRHQAMSVKPSPVSARRLSQTLERRGAVSTQQLLSGPLSQPSCCSTSLRRVAVTFRCLHSQSASFSDELLGIATISRSRRPLARVSCSPVSQSADVRVRSAESRRDHPVRLRQLIYIRGRWIVIDVGDLDGGPNGSMIRRHVAGTDSTTSSYTTKTLYYTGQTHCARVVLAPPCLTRLAR